MSTKKPTHLVVTTGKQSAVSGDSNPLKKQLEMRANRFGLNSSSGGTATASSSSSTSSPPSSSSSLAKNPADAEKLAARAARFADLTTQKTSSPLSSTAKVAAGIANNNPIDADRLARRAARFADIPIEPAIKNKAATKNNS